MMETRAEVIQAYEFGVTPGAVYRISLVKSGQRCSYTWHRFVPEKLCEEPLVIWGTPL
jgi:hypothetical protein